MAQYYVSLDGTVSKQNKKKKQTGYSRYSVSLDGKVTDNTKKKATATTTSVTKKEEEKERTWFKGSSLFDDGYQFTDVSKTILGTYKDVEENFTTGILGMGEKAVDAGAYLAGGVGGLFGADKFKNNMQEFIEKDLYDEEKVAKKVSGIFGIPGLNTGASLVVKDKAEEMSVFGEKSDALVQSGGQLAGTVALQAVGVPWWATTGVTSFGGEAESTLKQGATYGEAGGSALITAGADVLTEKLSGGIKFGGKTLDDVTIKPLVEKISNKAVRTLTNLGVDAVGEGTEEVIAGVFSNLGTALYKEESIEELLASEEALDEYIESFIGGAVLGGGVSGGRAIQTYKAGRDYKTGLTDNEQKVVDAELNSRIAEEEADGHKLTSKEKTAIEEQVKEDLQKGRISIDTIESTLGGETYSNYRSVVEQEEALTKEIEALENLPREQITVKQGERLTELRKNLEELGKTTDKAKLKDQLSREVQEMTRGDLLTESYNEKARRSQAFEADLTQYDARQQETVKRAVESGILNNTNRTHEFVDLVARISADKGVLFDFTNNEALKKSGFALDGKTVNGYVKDGSIALNIDSAKALNTVVGHEITHVLEGTDLYGELQQAVVEYAKTKGEYDTRVQALSQLYEGVEGVNIDNELTADLVGEYLFTDSNFINKLSTEKPNIFKKIYEEIKYLAKMVTGTKEAKQLEKVKRAFDKAYKEGTKATDGKIKYDIKKDADGKLFVDVTEDIFADNPGESTARTIQKVIAEKFNNLINANGQQVQINKTTNDEFRRSNSANALMENPTEAYNDKLKAIANADEILTVAKSWIGEETKHLRKDDIVEFARGNVTYRVGENGYVADVIVAIRKNGSAVLYDLVNIYDKQIAEAPVTMASNDNSQRRQDTSADSILSQNQEGATGNVKYSLSEDSEGKPLSPAIQKRFGKSKAVDENGSLKVLYHGTPSGEFTIFDKSKGSVEGDFGSGFYFTDNAGDVATNYEGGGPDFENKVARRAEQIEADEDIDYDEAEQRAREELFKGSHKFEVYLNIEKPAIVGETILLEQDAYLEEYDPDDYDDYDDYLADVEQMVADDIENIVWEVEKNVDLYSTDGLADILFEAYYEGGIGIEELKAKINELYLETNDGELAGNEVTRQIIESLGYDGIIDSTVSSKFRNMGLEEGTTHYIVFKPNQIKSISNENPTDNPDINLSLSKKGQDIAPVGDYNVYGQEIALEGAQEAVTEAPGQEVGPTVPTQEIDEYAPLTEEEANARDAEQIDRFYSLSDSDMPEELEAPYYEDAGKPDDPFMERDIKDVGNRKVKAYMYENPEVKPFFQAEAENMLWELQNSVKGEKTFNDQLYYDTNGEQGWFGTKRETSDDIAYLLDNFKYTYADIEKGLRAIIEDHGAENNAVSKRIEFALNDRLRDGYTDFMYGQRIPPNQDYVNLLTDLQINSYSDEAYYEWLESLAQVEPTEDIAPVAESTPVEKPIRRTTDDIAPSEGVQRVMDLENGQIVDEEETPARKTHGEIQRAYVDGIKKKFSDLGLDFDKVLEKAKNLSTFATVDNTPQRVMEKALGYKEGQLLSEATIEQEALNESRGIKWLNSFTHRKNGQLAKISKQYGIKPNSKEDASAQMYGEGFYVTEAGEYVKYGDAELAMDFPDVKTQERIKGLAKDPRVRQIYDETLEQINESRVRNGYPEIPKRKDYFLHFRAMDDTFSRLGIPFNPNDIKAKDLPTDLAGMTADLKPGQPYFASAMQRKGNRTSYSLLGGMERYLTSAKNQIYHIDDIQTLRGLRNYIADMYGQAHGLESLDTLTEEEAEARIKEVYDAHLSSFAKFLNEQANVLAGKTSLIDRGLEGVIGRRGITTLNTINSQVAKNMVGFNVSSSLTNFVGAVQGLAKANKFDAVKAFSQVAFNKMTGIFGKTDGFVENDPGMIRRQGAEKFYRTPYEKISDVGYTLMSAVDNLTSEFLIRAKYNELTRKGMDSKKAHIEADKWAMRILGDRSLGQQPQLYNSKMLGLVTKFQLEVRNQLDSMFYDTVQEANVSTEDIKNGLARNAKKSAKIASTMVQLAVFQHLFGKAFESVAGYNPAFDIVSVLMTLLGYDDEEDSEDTFLDNTEQAFLELLEDLPYSSALTGGRIPIQSALPIAQLVKGEDSYGNEKSRWETLAETLPYYVMPGGYNQIKKTTAGLEMFNEDHLVTGSYTDSGNLRFPIEDTPQNRLQAGVFGQWASETARDYFDNERKPLKEKQIQEYADLDMPIKDYWEYREGLADQETLEDKFDYIAGLDLPVEKKNIMINNVVDRKEEVDLTNYDDFANYEEFDFAIKNPEKYEYLQSINVPYTEYNKDEESREAYNWAYKNPEKYTVSKAVDDVVMYRRYAKALNEIKADVDAEGKTISGSRKEKVANYINDLGLDYGAKIILYKSEYEADDTYNEEIIEYLNNREDISYSDMESILKSIGFTVDADGTVRW